MPCPSPRQKFWSDTHGSSGSRTKSPRTKLPRTKSPWTKSPQTKSPWTKCPHYVPPNCSTAQYFLLYINVIFEGQFFPPLLVVIYSMVMKWRSIAERSRRSKCVCSQDLNSESDCFPPLPLFYMDSETMGDRNFRYLSLIGCTDCGSTEVRIVQKNLPLNFGGIFWLHFFQANNEIYTRRSSFPFDTRKVNTGFIWQWILTILTKFYGGYFSRFYKSLIKGCTNQCTD